MSIAVAGSRVVVFLGWSVLMAGARKRSEKSGAEYAKRSAWRITPASTSSGRISPAMIDRPEPVPTPANGWARLRVPSGLRMRPSSL